MRGADGSAFQRSQGVRRRSAPGVHGNARTDRNAGCYPGAERYAGTYGDAGADRDTCSDSRPDRAAALGLPEPPDIDINSWEYILANADNSIAEYAPPELVTLEGQLVDSRIADALAAMAADTRAQGLSVYLSSGYRSYADQAANFLRVCRNNGVSDGKDSQGYYITMPAGHSEHQTGLCCDITDIYYPTKNRSIENTAMFQYMNAHCQEFGFILRFPDGMEPITGVMYEPFHFRYVGVEAAKYITENNICFETFVSLYRDIGTAENPQES